MGVKYRMNMFPRHAIETISFQIRERAPEIGRDNPRVFLDGTPVYEIISTYVGPANYGTSLDVLSRHKEGESISICSEYMQGVIKLHLERLFQSLIERKIEVDMKELSEFEKSNGKHFGISDNE